MQLSHPTCSYVHTVTEWWPILIRLAVLLLLNTAWDLQTDADKRHWKIARLEQHCTPQAKPMSKGGEKVGQRREVQGVCMWVGDQARYMQGRGLERWEVGVRVFLLSFIHLFAWAAVASFCHLGGVKNVPEIKASLPRVYLRIVTAVCLTARETALLWRVFSWDKDQRMSSYVLQCDNDDDVKYRCCHCRYQA